MKYCVQLYKIRVPLSWDSHPGIGIHDLCSKPHCLIEFSAQSSLVIALITAFEIWGNQRLRHSPQIPHLQFEFRTSPVSFTHSSMCGPHMCKAHTYPCANAPCPSGCPFTHEQWGSGGGTNSLWKWLGSHLPMRKRSLFTLASFIPEISFLHVMLSILKYTRVHLFVYIWRFFFYPSLVDFIAFCYSVEH